MVEQTRRDLERRRSQRVFLRVRVVVHGQSGAKPFEEETVTSIVNAHGALMELAAKVESGQVLVLQNKGTGEKQECRVVHIGARQGTKAAIGVEFTQAAAHFWNIDFPPESGPPGEKNSKE
jgi:hypothetical protein